jgi:quinol-cytochrome oxidoreductase complex cytochrome b subunit
MTETDIEREEKTIPFYPDHVLTEAKVAVGILLLVVAIGILSIWLPVGQGVPADPMDTPAHTKPEWYFLFLYEILKYIPKTIGAVLPFLGIFILILWPFFDRSQDSKKAQRIRLITVAVVMIGIIALTLLGEFS